MTATETTAPLSIGQDIDVLENSILLYDKNLLKLLLADKTTKCNIICMDYITTKEFLKKWGITDRMVVYHCSAGRIKGAKKMGNTWLVPANAEKPIHGRYKTSKGKDGENK